MFGRPLAETQSIQIRLADMARRITTAQLLSLQLGRLKDHGRLTPTQVSLAKWNNCRMALDRRPRCPRRARRSGHQCRIRTNSSHAQPRKCYYLRGHRDDSPAHRRPRAHGAECVLTAGWGAGGYGPVKGPIKAQVGEAPPREIRAAASYPATLIPSSSVTASSAVTTHRSGPPGRIASNG